MHHVLGKTSACIRPLNFLGVDSMKRGTFIRIALTLALAGSAALCAAQAAKTQTFTGYISDSKCGAMHMDNGVGCVTKCIENGNHPVLVDAHKRIWFIENPESVKSAYGDNVKLDVTVNAKRKSIYINKVTKTGGVMGGMKDGMSMKM
jgi:hypothetical protein